DDAHDVSIANFITGDGDVPPDECVEEEPCETEHRTPPDDPAEPPKPEHPKPEAPAPSRPPKRIGPLPVTGASVTGLVLLGASMVLVGIGLRRRPRRSRVS